MPNSEQNRYLLPIYTLLRQCFISFYHVLLLFKTFIFYFSIKSDCVIIYIFAMILIYLSRSFLFGLNLPACSNPRVPDAEINGRCLMNYYIFQTENRWMKLVIEKRRFWRLPAIGFVARNQLESCRKTAGDKSIP
jgi:hypothetical protein